jgi:molybdate transport repressor ModE-like protein
MDSSIYAVILADDTREDGTQFGPPDDTEGVSSVRRITEMFTEAGVAKIVVASIRDAKIIKKQCRSDNTEFALGEQYSDGILRVAEKSSRVFVLPTCYPTISSATITAMADSEKHTIVVPKYNDERGFPLLIPSALLPEINQPTIPGNLSDFIQARYNRIHELEVDDHGVVTKSLWCKENSSKIEAKSIVTLTKGEYTITPDTLRLLRFIDDVSTIRDACSLMGISISLGLQLINRAEKALGYPLIWRQQGGRDGGNSVLTVKGRAFIDSYEVCIKETEQYALEKFREYIYELVTE